jgi:Tfp pilus assembly protein PilN
VSQQINLYNPLFLKQEKHFSARTMAQALGIIALGLAALYAYGFVEGRKAERSAQLQRELLAAQRDQLIKLTAQFAGRGMSKPLEAEVARAETEVRTRLATLEALNAGELGNTAGFSDFFAAFGRQAMHGVWLTGFSIGEAGNTLTVSGRALQADLVPAYLKRLNNEAMMRGRRVIEMKLAAKEAPVPSSAAKPVAGSPEQYVEFAFVAPATAPAPAAKGGKP